MIKYLVFILPLLYVDVSLSQTVGDSYTKPVVKLTPRPKMRPVDRDWAYFKAVGCERIQKEVFHSRSEEVLLAKRKSQCMNKYQSFFSKPIDQ